MNTSTDPLSPETEAADPVQPKPVRRRRTVALSGEEGVVPQSLETAFEAAPPTAPAKAVRKRRAAAPAADAAQASAEPSPIAAAAQPPAAEITAQTPENIDSAQRTSATPTDAEPAVQPAQGEQDPQANGALQAPDSVAIDERPERSRRRNRRERQRANRAAEGTALQAEPVSAQTAEQLGTLFAQVVSGDFDAEDAAAVDAATEIATADASNDAPTEAGAALEADAAAEGGAAKRVLAPEPDAPKLQKVLGQAGVGSRRDMEELIADGRVTVNGEPAHTGQRISWGDRIEVNGRPIKYRIAPPPARVVAYHKPVGEVVTHDDPQQRPTVFRNLPRLHHGKWQSVGRLDINTEGLLLFTNSGELANQLMHPRFGVEREYAVRVLGALDAQAREKLLQGVTVDGQTANFKSIEDGGGEGANRWYRVVIAEGRNREVRKLFDSVGLTVSRLIRIRYGNVVLPRGLKRGVWVDLGSEDVRRIRQLAGGARPGQAANDNAQRAGRGPQGGDRGDRGARPNDRGNRNDRGPRRDGAQVQDAVPVDRGGVDGDEDLDFDPMRIPNPLEQTFDRRFAKNQRSPFSGRTMAHGGGGFGAGGSAPEAAPKRGGGPKEPDPLQTSLGFIGADAFHRKSGRSGGGGGGGGQRGGQRGGGKGGKRGR